MKSEVTDIAVLLLKSSSLFSKNAVASSNEIIEKLFFLAKNGKLCKIKVVDGIVFEIDEVEERDVPPWFLQWDKERLKTRKKRLTH
jgi:hypothetical protein